MNVAEAILSRGDDDATAVICRDAVLTHGELRQKVARLASGLCERGHGKGDRIGIFSENSPFFVIAYLGIIRAGLVAVPLQTEISPETFIKIASDAGIKEVFVSHRFRNRLRPWAEKAGVPLAIEGEEKAEGVGQRSEIRDNDVVSSWQTVPHSPLPRGALTPPDPQPSTLNSQPDLAALMFTSGSTGAPKGVMVSHRNIECNSRDIISYMALTREDRAMVVLPFHYCYGVSLLHTHLMVGGSVVLNNEFKLYPEAALQQMQQEGCTGLAGVPSTYQLLLRKSRFRQMNFPRLRWFQQAGGKLPNPCIMEILSAFPQVRFFLMYGQTEATARLSYLPPERLANKLGSIGKGLPSTRLEVLRPDGTPVAPGSFENGEIVAAGDNIALGYWNDPEETAKYFINGKLHTGDIAHVDSDGFIFLVDRERDLIKAGGNRVSAREVEDVIAEMPEVVEVAVLGAPHDLLGEVVKAFVVINPLAGITPADVETHCRKRLPPFKTPQEVVFLSCLPHNSSGKILKANLKQLLETRITTQYASQA